MTLVESQGEDVKGVAAAEEAVDTEVLESIGAIGRVHGFSQTVLLESRPVGDDTLLAILQKNNRNG